MDSRNEYSKGKAKDKAEDKVESIAKAFYRVSLGEKTTSIMLGPGPRPDVHSDNPSNTFLDRVLQNHEPSIRHIIAIGAFHPHHPKMAKDLQIPEAPKNWNSVTDDDLNRLNAFSTSWSQPFRKGSSSAEIKGQFETLVKQAELEIQNIESQFVQPDFVYPEDDLSFKCRVGNITTYQYEKNGKAVYIHHLPVINKQRIAPDMDKTCLNYLAAIWNDCHKNEACMYVHCKGGTGRTGNLVAGFLGLESANEESFETLFNLYEKDRNDHKMGQAVEDRTGQKENAEEMFRFYHDSQYQAPELSEMQNNVDENFSKKYGEILIRANTVNHTLRDSADISSWFDIEKTKKLNFKHIEEVYGQLYSDVLAPIFEVSTLEELKRIEYNLNKFILKPFQDKAKAMIDELGKWRTGKEGGKISTIDSGLLDKFINDLNGFASNSINERELIKNYAQMAVDMFKHFETRTLSQIKNTELKTLIKANIDSLKADLVNLGKNPDKAMPSPLINIQASSDERAVSFFDVVGSFFGMRSSQDSSSSSPKEEKKSPRPGD